MRVYAIICASITILIMLSGCTFTSVDGKNIVMVAPSSTDVSDSVDEYYEGLFSGCVQSLIVQNKDVKLTPEMNQMIVRQCMVVTAGAIKNDSHMSGVPGWPGVEEIRRVLEEIEDESKLELLGAADL